MILTFVNYYCIHITQSLNWGTILRTANWTLISQIADNFLTLSFYQWHLKHIYAHHCVKFPGFLCLLTSVTNQSLYSGDQLISAYKQFVNRSSGRIILENWLWLIVDKRIPCHSIGYTHKHSTQVKTVSGWLTNLCK